MYHLYRAIVVFCIFHFPRLFPLFFNLAQVVISKDIRTATSLPVRMSAIAAGNPIVLVSLTVPTQGPSFQVINSLDVVQLTATVASLGTPVPTTISWWCTSANIDILSSSSPVAVLQSTVSSRMVFPAQVLQSGKTYSFTATAINNDDPSKFSQANISFSINSSPCCGSCSISPTTGIALQTQFDIKCLNWDDAVSDMPLQYKFDVFDSATQDSSLNLRNFQPGSSYTGFLPAPPTGVLQIRVQISDRWGAVSSVMLAVNVTNPPLTTSSVAAVASAALDRISVAAQSGDINAAAQVIGPLSNMLNAAATQNSSSSAVASRTNIRTSLFAMSQQLIENSPVMSQGMSAQILQVVSAVTSAPAEMSPEVRQSAAKTAVSLGNKYLTGSTTAFPPVVSQTLLNIVSSVFESSKIASVNTGNTNSSAPPVNAVAAGKSVAASITNTAAIITTGMLIGAVPDMPPTRVESPLASISAQRTSTAALTSSSNMSVLPTSSPVNVNLPSSLTRDTFKNGTPAALDFNCVTYSSNIYSFADSTAKSSTSAPIVSFSVANGGVPVKVAGLSKPIMLTIPHQRMPPGYAPKCRYWSESKSTWSSDGCKVHFATENFTICACTHLTAFNVETEFIPPYVCV